MKHEVQIFDNNEFGQVRTIVINGEPWFVGKDITNILGYKNGSRDINRHVDEDDRQNYQNGTFETSRGMIVINESGLFSLILSSKLESAKSFKHWVTADVLPTIRKTGTYNIAGFVVPQTYPEAMRLAADLYEKNEDLKLLNETKTKMIAELEPKARYTEIILNSEALVATTQIAKDYGLSAQQFNVKLHEHGIQYKLNGQWLLYAKYHSCGYVGSQTVCFNHSDGRPDTKMTTKWTQKGRLFLYEVLKNEGILPIMEQQIQKVI